MLLRTRRAALIAGVAGVVISSGALAQKISVQNTMPPQGGATIADVKSYFAVKKPGLTPVPNDISTDTNGAQQVYSGNGGTYAFGFEGISQYDNASFARNFIPPDTNGAAGKTQYLETSNGAMAVFDKATGNRLSVVADNTFWGAAGQTGSNGDNRVLYNADAGRWIVVGFGADVKDLQIAISDTDDALGGWKSVKFEGYNDPARIQDTADYPTLAFDKNAVYIGTNNFSAPATGGGRTFQGTTLNVIPINSLFNSSGPSVNGMTQFNNPCNAGGCVDAGFAIQGVMSSSNSPNGTAVAASLFVADNVAYSINNAGQPGASMGPVNYTNAAAFNSPTAAHQPSVAIPANQAIVDALDERISSTVYEVKGRIYYLTTVKEPGAQYDSVRYYVLDKATNTILDSGAIGDSNYDYFQGSIAVNSFGQLVIAYNRSGLEAQDLDGDGLPDGNISFMARTFYTDANGKLIQVGDELKLKVSLTDDYHNGSLYGNAAAGRQRWGDYSQVSLDPTNNGSFWAIGQFAREYNLPQFGHPNGTGGSRWSTWVAKINFGGNTAVPEPATWAMMILGFGLAGAQLRRRVRQTA